MNQNQRRRLLQQYTGNSVTNHQGTIALPGLLAIMFLAVIVSLWISTAEAFVVAPTNAKKISISHNTVAATTRTGTTRLFEISAEEALERTKRQLINLQKTTKEQSPSSTSGNPQIELKFKEYLSFPANAIKKELKSHGLPTKGRKPDLARRLAEFEFLEENPDAILDGAGDSAASTDPSKSQRPTKYLDPKGAGANGASAAADFPSPAFLDTFCGLPLSETAGTALGRASFATPTPIQRAALPRLWKGRSAILHAETGSGKTLAYLLPVTEALWRDERSEKGGTDVGDDLWYGLVLTPTRELASQVAGVASALAPPGSVRLITRPTNLLSEGRYWKERRGDRIDDPEFLQEETLSKGRGAPPRLFVGSAKAILGSLYGDGKMPAPPTRKPAAKELLARTRWVVLDEVDRLLRVKTKKGLSTAQRNQRAKKSGGYNGETDEEGSAAEQTGPLHEKPAAILTSAVARRTLGRAQVIAASATVGRSLKRELSRVLGLPPKEYPEVIRGDENDDQEDTPINRSKQQPPGQHIDRAVTIPGSVRNYVLPVDASSTGKLLTSAFFAIKNLNSNKKEKILLVLTKGCGITTTNAIGALKHFRCQPEPKSLLDVLQEADGTDQLMDVHRKVAGSEGIGANDDTLTENEDGYLLVTGEDTVRGMHLAGLDTVVVVGRAKGPDEYIHIAGRTGRAGNSGKVVSVVSPAHAVALKGWETLLQTDFVELSVEDMASLE